MTNSSETLKTPILFLVFNRPSCTEKVFKSISAARPSKLYVAADGPRLDVTNEANVCQEVREIATKINWDCEVRTLFREQNLGCKNAVSGAIDWFFEHEEEGIILEDDCLPASSFFTFCSQMLQHYRDDEQVMMVSGNNFQDGKIRGDASYYFSSIPHIWGWATWRRAWKFYDKSFGMSNGFSDACVPCIPYEDENIVLSWQYAFALTYFKKVNTWDYQWVYTIFSKKGLSIAPQVNLVRNIDLDGGTHTRDAASRIGFMELGELGELVHPSKVRLYELADLYEYEKQNLYPLKKKMSIHYRWRRYRRARRLKIKINRLLCET